jgi:ribosome-associated protein
MIPSAFALNPRHHPAADPAMHAARAPIAHAQPNEPDDSAAAPFDERPSKTRLKQASHDLQDLGEAAVALPDARLAGLAIDEVLLDAINQYKKTRTHEGKRRQMQYIGKLMRTHDVEPIRQAVTDLQLGRAKDSLALHQAERWRAELIADDDALTRWAAAHAQTDVQQLRSLIRAARKDAALVPEKRSGRAYRELFQFIKQHAVE